LIDKLEDPEAKSRLGAAKQLFREFKPHDPTDERPHLVEQLTQMIRSGIEPDVRSAAACMLGSYGDQSAIPPLVASLQDKDVAATVVSALHYLSLYYRDSRIADGLCAYLEQSPDPNSMWIAMSVLEDFQDRRLAVICERMLDRNVNSQLLSQAAFAIAALADSPVEVLAARLKHTNPEVRTAAAAALRKTEDRRAIPLLRKALQDPDPNVRIQATMSLRFFGEDVLISPEDEAEAKQQNLEKLRAAGIRLPEHE